MFIVSCIYLYGVFISSMGYLLREDSPEILFEEFIRNYGKQYDNSDEKQMRFSIFKNALAEIDELNSLDFATYDVNQFADLSKEEFISNHTGHSPLSKMDYDIECQILCDTDIKTYESPSSLDLRSEGYVSEVKDQGKCSAGWAFATAGNVEGQHAKKYGSNISLSAQELIDCCHECDGCHGGCSSEAMSALIDIGGLESEEDYPYEERQNNKCYFSQYHRRVKVVGCTNYDLKDEDALKELLYQNGPLYIAVNGLALKQYSNGIMRFCRRKPINHAVLLTGYGTENYTDYWTIKNSWGEDWGEDGYARIRRGFNACGLMNPSIGSVTIE